MSKEDVHEQSRWLANMATWAIQLWIAQLVLALYSTSVAHFIFRIPVGEIVNVQLALQIFLPVAVTFIWVAGSALEGDFSNWSSFLFVTIPAYFLTPSVAIVGYIVFAYFTGVDLSTASYIYADYMSYVHGALQWLAHLGASFSVPHSSFVGSPQFFNWSQFIFSSVGLLLALLQAARSRFYEES